MTPGANVVQVISLVEDHVAMGAGAIVRARHRYLATLPSNEPALHDLLADITTELHGNVGRPKNRKRRKAQRLARKRNR